MDPLPAKAKSTLILRGVGDRSVLLRPTREKEL